MNADYQYSTQLKNGFRHVIAIERQAIGWLCLDPSMSNLFACMLPAAFEADVMGTYAKLNPGATILHLHVKSNKENLYPSRAILSCVSVMQYLIGVNWRRVLTPWQLYNKIKSNSSKHIEVIKCPVAHQKEKPNTQQDKRMQQGYNYKNKPG